ncbi:MAG: histidine kinase [Calditrichaeota bacterium]|nr:MAG: histidine kinase [Calditrichota bacterium]
MRYRIRDVILVSSLYDLYVFEEDGRLYELIREEFRGLNLSYAPELIRVSSGEEAIKLASDERRFDLIITTPHIEDMDVADFARRVRDADLDLPVVLLAYDNRELNQILASQNGSLFDRVFIWQGDFRILIGIIKHIEDSINVEHDTKQVGVQTIILVEDNVRFYSSFLPIIYMEIFKQSMRLISEGVNLPDRYLRLRARPKILLCTNYEDAWYQYQKYKDTVLGIISDIDFMRNGKQDPEAGLVFARNVKKDQYDIPILLQSNKPENESKAHEVGASFLWKDSPTLLYDLRKFMIEHFSFGDFVFRTPDGKEVGRANDLNTLEQQLHIVPDESIRFHAERNHFSNWLKARTEFWLAYKLRPRKVSEFASINELRQTLISSLRDYRKRRQRGVITDFKKETFDPQDSFARIGGGSLGGKARGLSFVNYLINIYNLYNKFDDVLLHVPAAVVIGTDVFDYFLDANNLRNFALSETDDQKIIERFLEATEFPEEVIIQLTQFLDLIRTPLAVRSSSLLEDSQYHPFAGVYETFMIPNNHFNSRVRLAELLNTIKRVYASTFYKRTKDYIQVTSYRLEEEKMAVIIQKMVGATHKNRFYPDFAGVAKSHNFYPIPPQHANDGIISVALGLGKTVVEGGKCVKFSPRYPNHLPQFTSIDESLKNSQQDFFALNLDVLLDNDPDIFEKLVTSYPLSVAEEDGTLYPVGSTYSHQNHAIYDGLSRSGSRLVTFAPILKHKLFPLPEILNTLLEIGRKAMGMPVEIEFAVNMSVPRGHPKEFGVLQMRPLVLQREQEQLNIDGVNDKWLICRSDKVLGNGIIHDIFDIVVVDYEKFDRSKSLQVAREVHHFNSQLVKEHKPYLLIGVGRWGTLDPWLGIPVKWEHICGARVIVEAGFKDFEVMPSQGSHFFQNITAFMVGYFTVPSTDPYCFVNWKWLLKQPPIKTLEFVRHLRFDKPLLVKMDGQNQKGIIFMPGKGS